MPETVLTPLRHCAGPDCEEEFLPRTSWTKFHSPECRRRHWRRRQAPRGSLRPARPRARARRRKRRKGPRRWLLLIQF